ncbi:hypothetical protein [Comamonas endophytica]|uniref:Uncharacterized protein n=1 Tax=Comamonas endophytica TaxID=2949090 RepID=A0ABY6GBQ6_9BURK|nr:MULTISPECIES: hypothetical protein [unclassified Acidovorax]MCD2513639.1 hypothetical protein [Acidovorax sp. D4N7]UYG52353.1 hypothetical protein M9799_03680 [Acidovorax sp. 5MLIR]
MSSWMQSPKGLRRSTQAWLDAPEPAVEVGYGGPADGDFARYVDQLLAQAEQQQRAARASDGTRAAAPPAAKGAGVPGAARARPAAAAARAAGLKALVWGKLVPMALLLVLGVAVFFSQGAVFALFGLLMLVGLLAKGLRRKKR